MTDYQGGGEYGMNFAPIVVLLIKIVTKIPSYC